MPDETMKQVEQWREKHIDAYRDLAWIAGVVDSDGAATMSPDPDMRLNRIDHALSKLETLMKRDPEGPDKPDES